MTDDLGAEAMTIVDRNGGTHQRIMLHELPDYIFHRYSTVNLTIPLGDLPHKNSYPYRRCKERCELFVGEESSVVSSANLVPAQTCRAIRLIAWVRKIVVVVRPIDLLLTMLKRR